MMTGATVCSGIGAPEQAAPWIDWRWCAEIDKQASAVLAAHHPQRRNLGDMTEIKDAEPVDIIVAGTPCQDFSVAGLRAGLAGVRGHVTLEFVRLLGELRPRWFVLENVPGLLSMDEGRAFGFILGKVAERGYGFAYRILDAQYFGLAQRRERLFVVGYLGDWRPPAAVLFERESLRRDSPPSREARQGVARPIASSLAGASGYRNDADTADNLVAFGGNNTNGPLDVATARNAHGGPRGRLDFESETFVVSPPITNNPYGDHASREGLLVAHSLRAEGFDASEDGTGRGTPLVAFSSKDRGADASDIAPTLRAMEFDKSHANGGGQIAVALYDDPRRFDARGIHGGGDHGQLHPPLNTVNSQQILRQHTAVRRLTPRECERLQGFPDDYTLVSYRGKAMADGPRYRMLGNAMAVPVIGWILERIALIGAHLQQEAA